MKKSEKITIDVSQVPFMKCIKCEHLGIRCSGPNLLAMAKSGRIFYDWFRLLKDYRHSGDPKITNQYISDRSMLSKPSVDRFFGEEMIDTRISTVSSIMGIIINDSVICTPPCEINQIPFLDTDQLLEDLRRIAQENSGLNDEITRLTDENTDLKHQLSYLMSGKKINDNIPQEWRSQIDILVQQLSTKDHQIEEKDCQIQEKDKQLASRATYIRVQAFIIVLLTIFLGVCAAFSLVHVSGMM